MNLQKHLQEFKMSSPFQIYSYEFVNSNYEDPEDAVINHIIDYKLYYSVTKFTNGEIILASIDYITMNDPTQNHMSYKNSSFIFSNGNFRKLFINDQENINWIAKTISNAIRNGLQLEYSYFFENKEDFISFLIKLEIAHRWFAEQLRNE